MYVHATCTCIKDRSRSLSFVGRHVLSFLHARGNPLDGLGCVVGKVEVPHLLLGHGDNGKRFLVLPAWCQTHLGGGVDM